MNVRALCLSALLALLAGCEKKVTPPPANPTATAEVKPTGPAATGEAKQPAAAPQGNVASGETLLIGEVGSMTGAEATFGLSTHHGIELAINEMNAAGGVKGKKLELKSYDDQGKPEEAANSTLRLISQDKVLVVLGEVASTNSKAMAPIAQKNGVPMISPASTNPQVTAVGDRIFRICFIDPFQGTVMAKFAKETLKFTKVAVLKDVRSDYSMGLSQYFTDTFKAGGGQIVGEASYSKGDVDFKAQLTQLKGAAPEAIYVPGYYSDVGLIAQQARDLGITAPLMGGDGWDSAKLFEIGGKSLEGSFFSNHSSNEDPSPRLQKFITDYKAKYGEVPDSLAALGYDAARVAADAFARAATLDGPGITAAIAGLKDFDGVTGKINLDANRNAVKPAVVLEIKDGKAKYRTSVAP